MEMWEIFEYIYVSSMVHTNARFGFGGPSTLPIFTGAKMAIFDKIFKHNYKLTAYYSTMGMGV